LGSHPLRIQLDHRTLQVVLVLVLQVPSEVWKYVKFGLLVSHCLHKSITYVKLFYITR